MAAEGTPWPGVRRRASAQRDDGTREARWLEDWRDEAAYVLLGDPGAGKSWSFQAEATAIHETVESARLIQAELLDELDPLSAPGRTVFIDALDEVRGGATPGADALGAIARWLKRSGSPRFRIACREADWRGEADRQLIQRVAPGGRVTTLHLEPLEDEDILNLLRQRAAEVPSPEAFMAASEQQGVTDLLRNPLMLGLMVDAVAENGGQWPESRLAVYEGACRRLADETSPVHRQRVVLETGHIDRILDDAGLLCAVLLLSGNRAVRVTGKVQPGDIDLPSLPGDLRLPDAAQALRSKVFTIEGGLATPRHRTIAEFLAARAIARLVTRRALPLGRVLAAMQGFDGKPVEAMRGLFAWLAVHLPVEDRQLLLRLDPLGFVLNGDAAAITRPERVLMLEALSASAADNQWFRSGQWVEHPFGPLATADMAEVYRSHLARPERDSAHQAFVDCLLDALKHARHEMPSLAASLAAWVEDATAFDGIRLSGYDAWKRHCPMERQAAQMLIWLEGLAAGLIHDPDDRLLGSMLKDAYPAVVQVEVLRYLRPTKNRRLISHFSTFWAYDLVRQTSPAMLPSLADAWIECFPKGLPLEWQPDVQETADELLVATLESVGDRAPVDKLHTWLGIGLGDDSVDRTDTEHRKRLVAWFEARPAVAKAVMAHGYATLRPDRHGHRAFWLAETRLRGASRVQDLLRWNMQLALASEDEDFVEWVVRRVASAALEPPEGLDVPDMDEVADWIEHVTPRFPSATDWLEQSWSVPLDHWRGDNFRRETRYRAEHEHARAQRIAQYAPLLEKLGKEPLHAGVLSDVAHAYQKHFLDIDGVTPQARIEDLLGTSGDATRAVLAALDATLERDDLPSVDEILKLDSRQRMHPIRPAVLLAAQRATQDDPDSYWQWPEQLRSKLVAFFLTEGMGDEPPWYKGLASNCPDIVAPILVRYASSRLRRVGRHTIAGVWALARDDGLQRLVELTLPDLLEHFPIRASEAARDILNQSLLPALPRLSATHAAEIVRQKLGEPKLDSGQRIAWLVSLLPFDASASSHLVDVVGRNPRRIAMLGKALREQGTLGRTHHELAPFAVQRLVALLAPVTPYEPNWPGGIVDEPRQREETVKALLDNLGRNPTVEAAEALKALAAARTMGHWQRLVEYQVQAQRAVHREATFRALGPSDVARLLANGPPAQISDLAALVFDQIQTMEGRLRGDSSFQLRQFWDKDNKPRPEDWCRDALANQLGLLLKSQKVDVQPESQAAAKKRVDLRATLITDSGVRLSLPIEAKKDNHRLVWTAWRDQLQWLYTTDPDAQGFGIYLVFWFDHESMPSPEGVRPSSAEAFASQIRARMPESDRHRLLVYALDLSWPPQAKR